MLDKPETRKIPVEIQEAIVQSSRRDTLSHRAIGTKFGVSRSSVRNILTAAQGIKRRKSNYATSNQLSENPAEHFGPMCAWIRLSVATRIGTSNRPADIAEAIDGVMSQIRSITTKITEVMLRDDSQN
jgi:hypothetical protein